MKFTTIEPNVDHFEQESEVDFGIANATVTGPKKDQLAELIAALPELVEMSERIVSMTDTYDSRRFKSILDMARRVC